MTGGSCLKLEIHCPPCHDLTIILPGEQSQHVHPCTSGRETNWTTGMATGGCVGMERWKGKVALVTGASSGLGYDLAKRLAQLGMNVVGCAASADNTEKIKALSSELSSCGGSGRLLAVQCDVRKDENILALFEASKAQFGGVDVCVNNAGLAHNSPLLTGATDDWREMLEVNILGMCICTREYMKQMKERGADDGYIFLLNSMSGHRVGSESTANIHFYSATKYAVTSLTEGMRRELVAMQSNIRITAISPGTVRTEFVGRLMKVDDIEQFNKDYGDVVLEAKDISSAIIYCLASPQRVQIHDILLRHTKQVL